MRTRKAVRYDEQVEREIEKAISKFSQHFMSNSKWVRLIDKLVENVDKLKSVEFKKIQSDLIGELYLSDDMTFGFDYWQNGFEGHNSLGGWLTYKEIEYLLFPKAVDKVDQELELIAEIINGVGQFILEISDEGLKLVCYRE
jgi:hypothetical protein